MIKAIRHTGIIVKNLEESLEFYRDKLGFEVVKQVLEKGRFIDNILGLKNVSVITVKMKLPESKVLIELLKYNEPEGGFINRNINDIGIGHIALEVLKLDEIYSELSKKGVVFLSKPCLSPDGYAAVCFCYAPEGTYIEFVEVKNESK